jgi:hypothetical protein
MTHSEPPRPEPTVLEPTRPEPACSEPARSAPTHSRPARFGVGRVERGSATLHVLFVALVLCTALSAAVLWAGISTTRHKLAAAADLTALSAAQALTAAQATTQSLTAQPSSSRQSVGTARPPNAAHFPSTDQPLRVATPTTSARQAAALVLPATPCVVAARTAERNDVQLAACEVTSTSVTVEVSLQLDLRVAHPTLTAAARAGPA